MTSTEGFTMASGEGFTMTPFQKHCKRWGKGCNSTACPGAQNVCLGRGTLPADVLFIGEAPGESEDCCGRPFVGPAGHLLDSVIRQSLGKHGRTEVDENGNDGWYPTTYAITNLVGCIPRDGDEKASEPTPEEIKCCAPRLREFFSLCNPRLVVCVGKLAEKWVPVVLGGLLEGVKSITITHPAAVLRANPAARGLMMQKVVVTIKDALEEF